MCVLGTDPPAKEGRLARQIVGLLQLGHADPRAEGDGGQGVGLRHAVLPGKGAQGRGVKEDLGRIEEGRKAEWRRNG